jgi:hypothetical protein
MIMTSGTSWEALRSSLVGRRGGRNDFDTHGDSSCFGSVVEEPSTGG